MAELINTLTETQQTFLRICRARGWDADQDRLELQIPAYIAIAAVEDLFGEQGRRLEAMMKIAERALHLQLPGPLILPRPPR